MKKIIVIFLTTQFYFSQDKGLSSFEKKEYKQSYDYYSNILKNRKNDISAKFGAGISAFKNRDIETGINYLQEVSKSGNKILASKAHFNLANIYKDENRLEESIYHYKKAIELNSTDRDSKINYEFLKKMLEQEDQRSKSNSGDEGDENQEDQGSQSNSGDESDENQEDQANQSNSGDEGDENQESQTNKASDTKNNKSESNELSDKQIQAEAILDALKNQEKINQKQKLIKIKAKNLEKDW